MKKISMFFILSMFLIMITSKLTLAETISYPFDTITIVEAKKFKIVIPDDLEETSLLYGLVQPGDIITVYLGELALKDIDSSHTSDSVVLILTDELDNDVIRYLINNFRQSIGIEMFYGFASHILIDASMGVYKDMDVIEDMQEISVVHTIASNSLVLIDNNGLEIPMIEGSFEQETDLNTIISVYGGQ